ncbi:hypothetical protein GGQ85_003373 [Nitrobacter vulgaris]|jgi:hypothetical protein|uniref:hypothetical protein n=1 Tax=Nitrobacter vulgaris TaxID=29421 RepID=UPI002863A893|nr:hypothetical protein [Nitrobacter vulgaris]MDR6305649.1 hypothetical protein [Nitrobacter vulgaris]
METEYFEENTPRTPAGGTRKQNEKPNFKETGERWKKPAKGSLDRTKPGLDKRQELKTGHWRHPLR